MAGRFLLVPVLLAVGLLAALASAGGARAQQAPPDFHLDLDTGGHRAFVKDMAFTPDGDLLVTASDDKTIRIWDWRAGRTLRTIRGEIGAGNDGKVFAVAVAPDGRTLAAAGYFGPGLGERPPYGTVRLFDIGSGRLLGILEGHEYAVYALDFSSDGRTLAVGGQDGFVQLWQREDPAGQDWVRGDDLDADSWHISRLAFAAGDTRLVATTTDNGVRLFDLATGEEIDMPDAEPLRDAPIRALAVSGDGTRFATGNRDGAVDVWNAADGTRAASLPAQDFQIGALAFVRDGTHLVAACGYRCADRNGAFVFAIEDGEAEVHYLGHDGTITAALPSPDGESVVTAGGTAHALHVWNTFTGRLEHEMAGEGRPVTAVGVTRDGGEIAWGNEDPCPAEIACPGALGTLAHRLLLPTPERNFERPETAGDDTARFLRSVTEDGAWALRAAAGGDDELENALLEIRRDGETLQVIANDATNGYLHSAFTLLADGIGLVTGGNDGTMIEYRRETGVISGQFRDGHTGEVDAIAEAPGRRLLVTGSADQTLRLWNLDTHRLVVSFFSAGADWIFWTPQGYYHSSPDGDRFVGWHVNQGPESEARFVTARQLRTYLSSPEIVRRAIVTGDAAGAARELRGGDAELARLLREKPPEFSVRLAEGVVAEDGFVAVEIAGAEEAGVDVSAFTVLSNDRRVDEFTPRAVGGDGGAVVIQVPVGEGENDIRITGVNAFGYLTERSVVALARPRGERPKGRLYVVAIGVEDYPHLPTECNGRSCNLDYAVDDVAGFMRMVKQTVAPLYDGMEKLVLTNRDILAASPDQAAAFSDLDAIMEAESGTISDEVQDFLDLPGPEDTTIVFVAGHGINIDEDYYFIPTDGRMRDAGRWQRSSLVDWRDIQRSVERAKGRRFMLLDTCHAANAFNPRLEKDAVDARIVVLSATASNSTAAEVARLGHGVFTYSLIEALKGGADSGDGVRLFALADYVDREVRRLTREAQVPELYSGGVENFLVARP